MHHGDFVIVNGLIFGATDALMCLDLATGKVKWRTRSAGKGATTYADGKIYHRAEQGQMVLAEATGAEYRELGRFEPPKSKASPWPHPVIAEGRLFLRDRHRRLDWLLLGAGGFRLRLRLLGGGRPGDWKEHERRRHQFQQDQQP